MEDRMSDLNTQTLPCPSCGGPISLVGVVEAEILVCPECGVDLEVTHLSPPALEMAPLEAEDWGE